MKAFFNGSLLPVEEMKAIRLRATVMGEAIAESDVKKAFNAYCETVGSGAFYNQTAFKDVESSLREMTEGTEPQIAMIVDESDWGGKTGNHPPVVLAMFPDLK